MPNKTANTGQTESITIKVLTASNIKKGLEYLSGQDQDLARIYGESGFPKPANGKPGFAALVNLIIEQQVSLASAWAVQKRLANAVTKLTPKNVLKLDEQAMAEIGLSRQKKNYIRQLAEEVLIGRFDVHALTDLDDDQARDQLMKIKGIGRWTADVYLLEYLGRADVWPAGDLILAECVRHVKRLDERPTQDQMDEIGLAWKPWRALAARLLWHNKNAK